MITALQRTVGNTLEFTITLPWSQIESTYHKIVEELVREIEVDGFRKGKAPREVALQQIDKNKVYEEVIKQLLPQAYADAIKEHNAKPIITPHVHLLEAEEGKDWKVKAVTCEKPTITIGKYKEAVAKARAAKKGKIWLPGEKPTPEQEKNKELTVGEVLDALYSEVKVELAPVLVEQEVNRSLSNLIADTQKLGLTLEQYLQSQQKNSEQLRAQYQKTAEKTLSLEFALEEIADIEKVSIEDKDIDTVIANAKTEEEKKSLAQNRYFITSLMRRQKTLSQLAQSGVVAV